MNEKELNALKAELITFFPDYIRDLGRETVTEGKVTKIKCINHEPDNHPSMCVELNRNSPHFGKAHCYACGASYDMFDMHMKITGKGFMEALADLASKYLGKTIETPRNGFKDPSKGNPYTFLQDLGNAEAVNYLKGRGISHAKEIADLCRIKSTKDSIYFPRYTFINGERVCVDAQSRAFQAVGKGARYKRKAGTQARVFDPFGVFENPPTEGKNLIAIVEGEIDCLSIIEAKIGDDDLKGNNPRPVALGGVTMLKPLETALATLTDLSRYGFIIMTDGDERGRQAALDIGKILEGVGAEYTTATDYPKEAKDPNDWLAKDRAGFIDYLKGIVANFGKKAEEEQDTATKELEAYKARYGAIGALNSLLGEIQSPIDTNPVKTGFKNVDDLLGGELEKGLVVLGAPSSLGKTTLMLQIADQIALSDRRDILFFTLEQSSQELIAKSVSRLTYLLQQDKDENTAKTTLGILQRRRWKNYTDKETAAIYRAFDAYRAIAARLYFHEAPLEGMTIEDIQEAVREHVRVTKNKPVVFIDYLQIIKPSEKAHTDKQAVDMTVSGLKRLSAQYGLTVFVVSSLSRAYYYEQSSTQGFKESGGIEYGADYALGLAFDWLYTTDAETPKDKEGKPINNAILQAKARIDHIREMIKKQPEIILRLTMLKHRNGATETAARFLFVKPYNCFIELTDELNHADYKTPKAIAAKAVQIGQDLLDESMPF